MSNRQSNFLLPVYLPTTGSFRAHLAGTGTFSSLKSQPKPPTSTSFHQMASSTSFYTNKTLLLSFFLLLVFICNACAASRMNAVDRCWRRDRHWAADRPRLALCAVGFAAPMHHNAGRGLRRYTVTDSSDDPVRPRPGTLRYGATVLPGKVWITFQESMQIKLVRPLLVKNFTTIDGRGANVHIAYGAGILLYQVSNVIVHGIQVHHIKAQPAGLVMDPLGELIEMAEEDGDAIRLVSSSKVWIDHNTLYDSEDGLLDATHGSNAVTVSNNWFREHDKVMLLGHNDDFVVDKTMQVTVAFNRFGPNCNQRMPRIRYGYAHLASNLYDGWLEYAVGGSTHPVILSQGNLYVATPGGNKKVTRRMDAGGGRAMSASWKWRSVNDAFLNGAFFRQTGTGPVRPPYGRKQRFRMARGEEAVRVVTRDAGALACSAATGVGC